MRNQRNHYQSRKKASMSSQKVNHCIMADLGKVEKILLNLEAMPECNGCTATIRKGRRIIRRAIKSMAQKKKIEVNWDLVDKVIQIVARLISLLNLERLKGFFNLCTYVIGLIYGCCCKAWQTHENDQNSCRGKTKRCSKRVEYSRPVIVNV